MGCARYSNKSERHRRKKMKTLEEIINRGDYKRMTERLQDATIELAEKIRWKMEELDLESWGFLTVDSVRSRSGSEERFLAYTDSRNSYNLETSRHGYYYYCNDFNCRVNCATNAQRLEFLNKAELILQELDEYETNKTAEIENALSKAGY